jgi:hypothetical protein
MLNEEHDVLNVKLMFNYNLPPSRDRIREENGKHANENSEGLDLR